MQVSSMVTASPVARTQSKPVETKDSDRFDFKQDLLDQAVWLTQQCRALFGCTPDQLLSRPNGPENFKQLAIAWREAHPRD